MTDSLHTPVDHPSTQTVTTETGPVEKNESDIANSPEVHALAQSIDLSDPSLSVVYGAETMSEIAKFADGLLANVRAKDAGYVGEALSSLMVQVKSIDVDGLGKKSFVENIPVLGSFFNSAKRTMAKFHTVSEQIEAIANKLDTAMVSLLKDVNVLEQLYDYNRKFHNDLLVHIAAGKERIEKARKEELPKLQELAKNSPDSLDAQKVKDFADSLNRFERRLHDLQMSRMITLQTAPQIRLIQSNDQTLAEKIQTSILSTIPIWKGQLVLALSLQGQKNAADLQKQVSDTTNSLLRKNAEMLQTSTIETAKEVERSIIDVETLRDVQGRLIATIEETLQITTEARERRANVEVEINKMEQELKEQLTSLASKKRDAAIAGASKTALPE